ncbi:MAG: oligoribonuclease [gamma proteobacterium symbiont of Taylorina sp.]|nr:oligoribonuclease [gamma proteobacterium symbiont of Taylorina sp.]
MTQDHRNLVWVDLEMTGLEPLTDSIIEIATIVTDADLNILAEGPVFAIHQTNEVLDSMDEWNTQHHGDSGLIERVRNSTVDETEAGRQTIQFLEQYIAKGVSPLCGNSICQDRRFMASGMPELEDWFHYRNLDVSTLKELAKRWYPDVMTGFEKKATHQALDDIRESIEELRYYRATILK